MHPKHHTDKYWQTEFKPATLRYVSVIAVYLLANETLLMAVPLFTVLLNNYTFFLKI